MIGQPSIRQAPSITAQTLESRSIGLSLGFLDDLFLRGLRGLALLGEFLDFGSGDRPLALLEVQEGDLVKTYKDLTRRAELQVDQRMKCKSFKGEKFWRKD